MLCTWGYQDRLQKETEYLGVLYLVVYPGIESVAHGYTQEDYKGVEYLWVSYSSIILATRGHTQTTHK